MTETQARQTFTAAQLKLEQAFTEFNKAKGALESITGQRAAMNTPLINAFSQIAGAADGPVLADY
ncbi:hypothetical protein [Comamonas sp. GB3 AK4-5]|uniref:hypothetical protein n=1 Tax=Comamonas sp. GB3 AK4-5 TaxID=3231487 RepID=UPI00351E7B80